LNYIGPHNRIPSKVVRVILVMDNGTAHDIQDIRDIKQIGIDVYGTGQFDAAGNLIVATKLTLSIKATKFRNVLLHPGDLPDYELLDESSQLLLSDGLQL